MGGTEPQDCRPGLETDFVLLQLYPPPYTLHKAFLGEGRKSQFRSLFKNLLMESFRDSQG